MLQDCFAKGLLNAKIIMNAEGSESLGGKTTTMQRMALLGTINRKDDEAFSRSRVTPLVIRSGTPISDLSERDLPSPAEIRSDNNVLLLPYYQEVEKRKDLHHRQRSKSGAMQFRKKADAFVKAYYVS
jgi:hypothetical protein